MTGVEERVKRFIDWWRETHCAECKAELTDGNVVVIDKKLICTKCYESVKPSGLMVDGRHAE